MLVSALFIAGCGTKQAEDTKAPATLVGIIDVKKAVKAHPKYNQLMALGQQADVISAQLEAQQMAAVQGSSTASLAGMFQNEAAELDKAFEQQFNAKMSVKQEELNRQIGAKADKAHQTLSDEMKAYSDQLDKEYQPRIFNLQLKLKTVQLAKEEIAVLQTELDKTQAQRSEALAAKQGQLAARLEELLAPEKAAAEQQLAAYAKELHAEISNQAAGKQAEMAARNNVQQLPAAQMGQSFSKSQEQLVMKQQEIQALNGFILADIKDKTAKVAASSSLETVLTNVAVNISAVDITTQVIAECNK